MVVGSHVCVSESARRATIVKVGFPVVSTFQQMPLMFCVCDVAQMGSFVTAEP